MTWRGARARGVRRLMFVGTNGGAGGTESHFVSLALAMADAGIEVSAVARPDDVIARALEEDGRIQVFPANFTRSLDGEATRAVAHACARARPDWMIGTFAREYWPLSLVARTQRIPLVLFLHVQRLARMSAPLLPWLASRFILPSSYLREWVVSRRLMPAHRTHVLYNPIDVDRFRPRAEDRAVARARRGFAADDVVVGFAGRLEHQKGAHILFPALESLMAGNARLRALWVGNGPLSSEIDAMIARSPHAERHVHEPWTHDIASCYRAMDVVAFPSIRKEAFGRVAAEAQASGVAVVGTRVGGIPETMREGESGLLVPPRDVGSLAAALRELIEDAPRRARMGDAGRRHAVEQFASPHIAERFLTMLATRRSERRIPQATAALGGSTA